MPTCHGSRFNAKTLEVTYREKNIAEVLSMIVDEAWEFFADEPAVQRVLAVLREVGLGYLRLGQPATELSGGEASASNWPPSCNVVSAAARSTSLTSPPRACIRRMSKS